MKIRVMVKFANGDYLGNGGNFKATKTNAKKFATINDAKIAMSIIKEYCKDAPKEYTIETRCFVPYSD